MGTVSNSSLHVDPLYPAWMSHIAAVVVYRCISEAMRRSFDPRVHLSDINWTLMVEGLLSSEDMKKVWYYIGKEVCILISVCTFPCR